MLFLHRAGHGEGWDRFLLAATGGAPTFAAGPRASLFYGSSPRPDVRAALSILVVRRCGVDFVLDPKVMQECVVLSCRLHFPGATVSCLLSSLFCTSFTALCWRNAEGTACAPLFIGLLKTS